MIIRFTYYYKRKKRHKYLILMPFYLFYSNVTVSSVPNFIVLLVLYITEPVCESVIESDTLKLSPSFPVKVIPEYSVSFLLIPVLVSSFTVILTLGLSVGSTPSSGAV